MPGIVRLEWQRDPKGYSIERLDRSYSADRPGRLKLPHVYLSGKSLGRKVEHYFVEGTSNQLALKLANTPCSPEGVQSFANEWGLLNNPRNWYLGPSGPKSARLKCYERNYLDQGVEEIYRNIRIMQEAVALLHSDQPMTEIERLGPDAPWASHVRLSEWRRRNCKRFGPSVPLHLRVRRLGTESTPRVTLDASNLLDFCYAEVLQMVGSGIEIRKCPRDGTLFTLGKVGQRATYCSDACRIAMHRLKKREKKGRAGRPRPGARSQAAAT